MNMVPLFKSLFAQNRKFEIPKRAESIPIVLRYARKKTPAYGGENRPNHPFLSMAAPQALECANGAHWVGRGPAVGVVQSNAILVSIQFG